jgi:thiol-disulfide isomerase/thioredoxin
MGGGEAVAAPLQITYVTAPRCHFCERGTTILADLVDRLPMAVREVDLDSDEGRRIAARWRVPYPPIVLVGDELVGFGRLSAKRLTAELTGRVAPEGARS